MLAQSKICSFEREMRRPSDSRDPLAHLVGEMTQNGSPLP
jgi:hypothetical protein